MKQKLYALDAFFIEKLKLSENDPLLNNQDQNVLSSSWTNIPLLVFFFKFDDQIVR